jgi:hypothetical protein
MNRKGSADAEADVTSRLSPVDAWTCNVNSLFASPERTRVRNVPEKDDAVVPRVPSLHTVMNQSSVAPV